MTQVRNILGIPAPRVYSWNSRASSTSVCAEYIIMEEIKGVQLQRVWHSLELADKVKIVKQIFNYQKAWLSASFSQIGSLYYADDIRVENRPEYLYKDSSAHKTRNERFAIGPASGRDWSDEGRNTLQADGGHCK
jgi:hypothetical protein